MAQTTRTNAGLRMTWDASIVVVGSTRQALAIAKKHGLNWFDLEEWDGTREAWRMLGSWAKDNSGRFMSIPASEQ